MTPLLSKFQTARNVAAPDMNSLDVNPAASMAAYKEIRTCVRVHTGLKAFFLQIARLGSLSVLYLFLNLKARICDVIVP